MRKRRFPTSTLRNHFSAHFSEVRCMFYQLGDTRRSLLCAASCSYACSSIVQFSHAIMFLRFLAFPAEQRAAAYPLVWTVFNVLEVCAASTQAQLHTAGLALCSSAITLVTLYSTEVRTGQYCLASRTAHDSQPQSNTLYHKAVQSLLHAQQLPSCQAGAILSDIFCCRGHHDTQTSFQRAPSSTRTP